MDTTSSTWLGRWAGLAGYRHLCSVGDHAVLPHPRTFRAVAGPAEGTSPGQPSAGLPAVQLRGRGRLDLVSEPLPVLAAEGEHGAVRVVAVADGHRAGGGGDFDAVAAVAAAVAGLAPGAAV